MHEHFGILCSVSLWTHYFWEINFEMMKCIWKKWMILFCVFSLCVCHGSIRTMEAEKESSNWKLKWNQREIYLQHLRKWFSVSLELLFNHPKAQKRLQMRDAPSLANQKLYNQIKLADRFSIEMPIDRFYRRNGFYVFTFWLQTVANQIHNQLKQIFR